MSKAIERFLARFIPFIIAGISIAVFIAMIVFLSYILLWGLALGVVLYGIYALKAKLFGPKKQVSTSQSKSRGRIIEHDDSDPN